MLALEWASVRLSVRNPPARACQIGARPMSLPPPPGEPNAGFPFQLYPGYPTYLPPPPPKPRSLAFKATIITLIVLVVLAPFALIFGVAYGLPAYRAWTQKPQDDALRRIHAQQPLFEDDLISDDGKWPVGDYAESGYSYFFSNGAYHLKGQHDDYSMSAPGAALFDDDVAVEATVAQRGRPASTSSSAGYDGVGLILRRAADGRDFVVFFIHEEDFWSLARYHYVFGASDADWTGLGYGFSHSIIEGDGVGNRLLVMARGATYYCWVNEHYLGAYQDHGVTLHGEREGFYMNVSSVEGIFSDFKVYPALSTDIFP
jgi:hypothetical protein